MARHQLPSHSRSSAGFTILELCITIGLVSVLALVIAQMNTIQSLSAQSSNAADEFNTEVSVLLALLNANGTGTISAPNGCSRAFAGMPFSGGLPEISPSAALLPAPSPYSGYTNFIASASPGVGLYTAPDFTTWAKPSGAVIRVTAPQLNLANQFFPPPVNHLWIQNLRFTGVIQPNVLTATIPPSNVTWQASIYNLHLDAQKFLSNGGTPMFGGQTQYSKDFFVTLWTTYPAATTITWCGPTPPLGQ